MKATVEGILGLALSVEGFLAFFVIMATTDDGGITAASFALSFGIAAITMGALLRLGVTLHLTDFTNARLLSTIGLVALSLVVTAGLFGGIWLTLHAVTVNQQVPFDLGDVAAAVCGGMISAFGVIFFVYAGGCQGRTAMSGRTREQTK